jgi:hypothetical protein
MAIFVYAANGGNTMSEADDKSAIIKHQQGLNKTSCEQVHGFDLEAAYRA